MSVYPPQDLTSRNEKTYSKMMSKYPNTTKQSEKIKELKKENKRLKKLLEKTEAKYKTLEKYIQVFLSKGDLK